MNSLEKQYAELLALTQLFLLKNHEIKDRIYSETEAFNYFRDRVKETKSRPKPAPPIQPVQTIPRPLPPINEPKKQPVAEVVEKAKTFPSPELVLDTPQIPKADTFENMRSLYKQHLPNKQIVDKIPDDSEAIKKSTLWKQKKIAAVAILSFNEPAQHQTFLQNLAKAIEHLNMPTEIQRAGTVEISKELRLIIACESHFRASPVLMKSFRETQSGHFFEQTPLLLLPDIAVYLKDANQKPLLWKTLKDILNPSRMV